MSLFSKMTIRLASRFGEWLIESYAYKSDFVPLSEFPEHELFVQHADKIIEEALRVCRNRKMGLIGDEVKGFFEPIGSLKWKSFLFFWYGAYYEENMAQCPTLSAILKKIPRIKSALLSIMEPGTHVRKHKGPYRGIYRYHFGIQVPAERDKCFIVVNGKKYSWQKGEGVLFDDTYEHWVQNDTSEIRIILFCDVLRDIPGVRGVINRFLMNSPLPRYLAHLEKKTEPHT